MRRMKRLGRGAAGLATGLVGAGCWYYRPLVDDSTGPQFEGPNRRSHRYWPISARSLSDEAQEIPLLVSIGRALITPVVITLSRLFLMGAGRFRIEEDENYEAFLRAMLTRDENQALLTVSNHRSMFDDPPILSCLLPLRYAVQPRYLRVNVCSQEYCFSEALPTAVHAFFGTGKSLPIWRGGGINQKLLLDYSRHVAAGEWCHLFPEGGVWQDEYLGGRGGTTGLPLGPSPCNRLRWGAGKIIAHAPVHPVVVPFFHAGMDTVLPMDPRSRKSVTAKLPFFGTVPRLNLLGGHDVEVLFGPPLAFSDLIEAHEAKHGPLVKVSPSDQQQRRRQRSLKGEGSGVAGGEEEEKQSFHSYWDSTPEERQLYRAITRRIERALLELNHKSNQRRRGREVVVGGGSK